MGKGSGGGTSAPPTGGIRKHQASMLKARTWNRFGSNPGGQTTAGPTSSSGGDRGPDAQLGGVRISRGGRQVSSRKGEVCPGSEPISPGGARPMRGSRSRPAGTVAGTRRRRIPYGAGRRRGRRPVSVSTRILDVSTGVKPQTWPGTYTNALVRPIPRARLAQNSYSRPETKFGGGGREGRGEGVGLWMG